MVLKHDKQDLLDDSVRFLGKAIDPYSTQHKKDVNFYREILLADAQIVPESRDVVSKHQMQKIKEDKFKPKSARELFNKQNFKTASIDTFDIKPFDKSKLMKDIDLRLYVPDPSINKMDLKSFRVPAASNETRQFELSGIQASTDNNSGKVKRLLNASNSTKSLGSITPSVRGTKLQSPMNKDPKQIINGLEKIDQLVIEEEYNQLGQLTSSSPKLKSISKQQQTRPQSARDQKHRKSHLSLQRHSEQIRELKNIRKTLADVGIENDGKKISYKSKQIDQFLTNAKNSTNDKNFVPLSTQSMLKEAKLSLEKQAKVARQYKITQMELNKKRNAAYIAEMRRKDILNQKKKIQAEPIELLDLPFTSSHQDEIVDEDESSSLLDSASLSIKNLCNEKTAHNLVHDLENQKNLLNTTSSKISTGNSFVCENHKYNKNHHHNKHINESRQLTKQEKNDELKRFNVMLQQSNKKGKKTLQKDRVETLNNQEEELLMTATQDFKKDINLFQIKSARIPSAVPQTSRTNKLLNNPSAKILLNQKQTQPVRLGSANIGKIVRSPSPKTVRVQTARESSQRNGGMSTTTRPQTAYFSSSHKTLQSGKQQWNRARLFSPSTVGTLTSRMSPTKRQIQFQQQAFEQIYQSTQQPSSKKSQKDMILAQLSHLGTLCANEQQDLHKHNHILHKTHTKETKRLKNLQEDLEQKCLTVLELGQKKDAMKDFRYEKHTFIYGKKDDGHYLRADGYDRVEVSERISKLNGKYAFMAENIKL